MKLSLRTQINLGLLVALLLVRLHPSGGKIRSLPLFRHIPARIQPRIATTSL